LVRSGTGDDRITTVNGARDVVDCGPGLDVLRADPQDVVRRCERVVRVRRGDGRQRLTTP